MYDSLPKKIKIGYKDYTISLFTSIDTSREQKYGHADHTACQIKIMPDLTNKELANTLYHEILHGVFFCFNVPDGSGEDRINHLTEERAVLSITNGIMAVYRDNPDLHDFFKKCLA